MVLVVRTVGTIIGSVLCLFITALLLVLGIAGFLFRFVVSFFQVLGGKLSDAELSARIWAPTNWAIGTSTEMWQGMLGNIWTEGRSHRW